MMHRSAGLLRPGRGYPQIAIDASSDSGDGPLRAVQSIKNFTRENRAQLLSG
jgi:hypothetical protein